MTALLTRVKSRLFIHSRVASSHVLDGAYASLQRGRSLDFEDLRAYETGDDVRDIDWRATARHAELLVKRSRATRMHTVLFAVDAGRGMAALAPDELPKMRLAILAVGALGLLAVRHGDDVSVVSGDASRVTRTPPRRSEGGLEHALRALRDAPADAPSSRERVLDHIARTVRRRAILVVVTGEDPLTAEHERQIRRLQAQHDVLWVTIRDADPVLARRSPGSRSRRDAESGWQVPAFLQGDAEVIREVTEARAAEDAHRRDVLGRLGVSRVEIDDAETAVPRILAMLDERSARVRG
ncbi:DUF58 domain-containing protein [Microbacterium indicum]|uniref:DUF58 domain-containing protein n=1 Tax=Microbacterium indicum TaxID=358100 RepID=UPI000425E021|nr:DUF58 domain-containing protein [Microbacterium indicum]